MSDRRPSGSLIFAHRAECAGASRCYGRPLRLVCLLACVAASPPHEKNPRMEADARRAREFRERPGYVRGAPARRLPPFGPRPSTSRPARAPPRRWPRCSACPHRPWSGACRRAASRPRWRVAWSLRRLPAPWPGLSATSTLPCSARRPRRAAFSGACLFFTTTKFRISRLISFGFHRFAKVPHPFFANCPIFPSSRLPRTFCSARRTQPADHDA